MGGFPRYHRTDAGPTESGPAKGFKIGGTLSRRLLPALLVATLWLAQMGGSASAFTDVGASHPFAAAIQDLADRGVIGGFADGTFGPEKPVWRQHFAKMIVLTLDLTVSEDDICPYADVSKPPGSLYPDNYIAVAAAQGITTGYPDGTFRPYNDISRAQVVTMVARAADSLRPGLLSDPPAGFSATWGSFSPTHDENARRAEANGLLAGLPLTGAAADPWGKMPRGEVAQVLHNLLGLLEGDEDYGSVSVGVLTDDARTVSATLDSTGGALSVTGADGTRYLLSLPEGALSHAVTLRMTPVLSMTDLPFGADLLAGVQLEPDGLRLLKPTALTITAGGDQTHVLGFAYEGAGDDFHLYPWSTAASGWSMDLVHFSGFGILKPSPTGGTPEGLRKLLLAVKWPGKKESRTEQLIALGAEEQEIVKGLRAWGQTILAQLATPGLGALVSAPWQYDAWRTRAQSLSPAAALDLHNDLGANLRARLDTRLAGASRDLASACSGGGDWRDYAHGLLLLDIVEWAQRSPFAPSLGQAWFAETRREAEACLSFVVDVDSRFTQMEYSLYWEVDATMVLHAKGALQGRFATSGQVDVKDRVQWEAPPGARFEIRPYADRTLRSMLFVDRNVRWLQRDLIGGTGLATTAIGPPTFLLDPGDIVEVPMEVWTRAPSGAWVLDGVVDAGDWYTWWLLARGDEYSSTEFPGYYEIPLYTGPVGSRQLTYQAQGSLDTLVEDTTITVEHKPTHASF